MTDHANATGTVPAGGETMMASRLSLTKIVATVGPASSDGMTIARLIEIGVSVFRLNFSHGTLDDHDARTRVIRSVSAATGRPVALLGDLQGPKIRLGLLPDGGIEVPTGSIVRFERGADAATVAQSVGSTLRLTCTYPELIDDVEIGQRVLINDGLVRMLIVEKTRDAIDCRVTVGGLLTSSKGMNLPDSTIRTPAMSERDAECVRWAVERELDFLALSFVRTASDIVHLRHALSAAREAAGKPGLILSVIAKIETPQAVGSIESIVDAADGIMVARGDLGVEMDLASVPVIQKRLIEVAKDYGKPSIVATQMLESMVHAAVPTRAEVSDVANAIFEETDAVMLSAETATGRYPALVVEQMQRIAARTESYLASQPPQHSPPRKLVESQYRTAALAHGAWTVASDFGAKFIVVWSQQGGGARCLSQNNFSIPIIACTSDERTARRMQLLRGVTPVRMNAPESPAHFTRMVDAYLLETGWAAEGDKCVLLAGPRFDVPGTTTMLAMHVIGDPQTGFAAFESTQRLGSR